MMEQHDAMPENPPTIEFDGRAVTPLVLLPGGTIAEVSRCKLLLATERDMDNLRTYAGTGVEVSFAIEFDLAVCVTAVYGGSRVGEEVEVRKHMPPASVP